MPKYYCDYCDIFLTHDSSSVRKAHNTGWKHINQVAQYYRDLEPSQTQEIIDLITFAHGYMPPVQARSFSPPKYDDRRDDRPTARSSRGGRSQSRSYTSRQHPYAEGMPPPPPPMPPTHAMSMMMSGGGGGPPMPPHGAGMRRPPPIPPPHMFGGGPALSAAPQFRDDRDREWRSRGAHN
ncbi:U1 small nuclear ribonucleoprotein C [Coemansia sp. S100]|nr:U1 small nuclear ribonucleoprotein C [Coemansia sp. S17]KAJ2080393.1 U1 small nuclear ribonucleoprotein C [Coemansia sp. S142-1]KAJ2096522.1 U1 small nuclear ribonucleoprotein C [Coemansia sp. S100]